MITERRWLRWLGAAIAIAGAAFVVREAWRLRSDVAAMATEPQLFGVVFVGAFLYAAALTLLALGWAGLVRVGAGSVPRRELVRIFAASSIAKYLPGNVFHFAGRQLLAGRLGVPQRRTAAATVTESVATLVAGIAMAAVALAGTRHALVAPALLAAIVVGVAIGHRRALTAMLGLACAFFLVNQLLVAGIAAVLGASRADLLPLTAVYLFSWAAGNALPGAPGGRGLREAACVSLTDALALATEPLAVTLAVAMRLISLAGDLLFFAGGGTSSANAFTSTELP